MTTPTLPELRANAALTPVLMRVLRVDQELADLGIPQSEQTNYWPLMQQRIMRTQAVEAIIQQLGGTRAQAAHFAGILLTELHQATTPEERRAYMSIEEAIGT